VTTAILAILAAAAPFLLKWLSARSDAKKDPINQRLAQSKEISHEIASNDESSANQRLDDWLLRVCLRQSNQQRSPGAPSPSKPPLPPAP
jgi:hypothetical protein